MLNQKPGDCLLSLLDAPTRQLMVSDAEDMTDLQACSRDPALKVINHDIGAGNIADGPIRVKCLADVCRGLWLNVMTMIWRCQYLKRVDLVVDSELRQSCRD